MSGELFDRWMGNSPWRLMLVGVAGLLLGLAFVVWPETFAVGSREALPGGIQVIGVLTVAFSGLGLVAAAVRVLRHGGFPDLPARLKLSGFANALEYECRAPSWECNDSYRDMPAAIEAATTWRLGAGADSIVEVIEVVGSAGRVRAMVDQNSVELLP